MYTHQLDQKKFDIRDHLDRLSPGNGKDKYVCPVCDGRNLQIESETGKYHCFTSDCENKAIREAIKPWAEVLAEREGNSDQHSSKRPIATKTNKKQPKPAPVTASSKLLRLPAPQRGPEPQKPQYIPEGVPASAVLITYSYSDTQQVHRFEWPDPNEPKGRDKTCRQSHINDEGKVKWNKGDKPWSAYRINEVVKTLKGVPDDEPVVVLMLEGEPNVELARLNAIAALTLQGCKWNDTEITRAVEALRATGKNIVLAKLRDNDATGVKKGSQVQSVSDRLQFPCIVIDPVAIYPDIPDKGDIKEILDNMDADEFIRRLEEEIHRQAAESARAIELEDIEEEPIDKSPTSTNLSMLEEAANEARKILRSEFDELTTNIKLEELRQAAGVNNNVWEDKIIKPLKRGMNGERFKLELLALMQMDDLVERLRQMALLGPKYNMGAGALKEAVSAMRQRTQTAEVRSMSLDELFAETTEAMEWIVPGMLPVGETVLLTALPKIGKSKLAIDLAFCIATGEERFLGEEVKQGRVLLVCPDASKQSLKNELNRRGFRSQDSQNLRVLPRWSIDQISVLEKELEDFRPDFVVIDSLKAITSGKEINENSAEFADNIITLNSLLTRYRAASLLVHHANKGSEASGVERARGSTAIVGACWGMWLMEPIPQPDPDNPNRMIVDPRDPNRKFHVTSRDSEGTILNIQFNAENNSWTSKGEFELEKGEGKKRQTINERLMNIFRINPEEELSGPKIMELLGGIEYEQRTPYYNALNRMENKRLISVRTAPGQKRHNLYSLPKFNQTGALDIVPTKPKISVPPPPPIPTVQNDDYSFKTHIQQGLENSHQNSHQIVITSDECASSKSPESLAELGLDPIVITSPLSQGGEGVKCVDVAETVTTLKPEVAQTQPIAPLEPETAATAPKSNAEWVLQIAAALRKAIVKNDVGAIRKEFAKTMKLDGEGQLLLAVKGRLNDAEREAFKAAIDCSKQSQPPDPDELAATLRQRIAENDDEERIRVLLRHIRRRDKSYPVLRVLQTVKAHLNDTEKEACTRILANWDTEAAPEAEPIALADNPTEQKTAQPTPEPTPAPETETETTPTPEPEPVTEPAPAPTPAAEFKIGDRVRIIGKGKYRGKCGEIRYILQGKRGNHCVRLDREGRRKTVDDTYVSASQIELVATPEVTEDE
ncbi:AAA family ATPase [Microcoleus sp. MON2_D5]|uniref:AAA family ATPase n=1 Tax=Microcoleus sp. MON2_D5 TaxID=2818833 RepID=UPI002FCF9D05